jgi:hypothetical protein
VKHAADFGGQQSTAKPGAPALRRSLPRVAALVSLFVVGCGGGDSDGGASQGSVSLEQFPKEFGALYCEKAFDCCSAEERSGDLFLASAESPGECATTFGALAALAVAQIVDAENAGRLRYDPEVAGECFAEAKSTSCAEYSEMEASESCSFGIIPLVPEGGACGGNNECITGRCVGEDDNAEPPVLGTCNASRGEGAACEDPSDCDTGRCEADVCAAKGVDGSPCSTVQDCESGVCEADVCVGGATECTL